MELPVERFTGIRPLDESRTVGKAFEAHDEAEGRDVVLRLLPEGQADVDHVREVVDKVEGLGGGGEPEGAPLVDDVVTVDDPPGHVLVRPYVAGDPLSDHLAGAPLPLADVLELAEAVLEDLQRAHEEGIHHGALRPSNVIVPQEGFSEAVVVDYGVPPTMADPEAAESLHPDLARHVSPEQAGLLEGEPGASSDLYQLGLLLYEAATGRFPYEGETFGEALRAHVAAEPEPPRRIQPEIPRALDQVIHRLLRAEPGARYQTAEGVGADLARIREEREDGGPSGIVVGAQDRRETLADPGFLDRERELAALDDQLEATAEGRGGVAVVEAVSGGGKTRLLEEFTQRGPTGSAVVYQGEIHEGVAQRPFEAFRKVVEQVAERCREDPDEAERIRVELGDAAEAVAEAFPLIGDLLGVEAVEGLGPDEYGEERVLSGLDALLDALGTPANPALVVLDDVQWADRFSVRLLRRWARDPGADGHRYTTVVVAYRSDEVPPEASLREVDPALHLHLPLFEAPQVRDLARSMAGPLPEPALDEVVRLAGGNPFMVTAVLRGLIEGEAIVPGEEGWTIQGDRMATVESSEEAAGFLRQRLERLEEDTLDFLTAGAILGKEFAPDRAGALVDLPPDRTREAHDEAVDRRILWPADEGQDVGFAHDKLREALLDRLDPEERRRLHRRAARGLQENVAERRFTLAHHLHEAGRAEEALIHALPAAREARERYALETAETYYEIALEGVQEDDEETRLEILQGLGDVQTLQGAYDEADRRYEQALEIASDEDTRVELQKSLSELAFKRGNVDKSRRQAEEALRDLGYRVPRTRPGLLLALTWEVLVQVLHTFLPSVFVGRRDAAEGERDLQAAELYSRLGHAYWFQRGALPTLWTHLRDMNLAERYTPSDRLAKTYSEHVPVMTVVPLFDRGIEYGRRSLEIRRDFDDLWGEGQSLSFLGVGLYAATRYEEALDCVSDAIPILDRTGDRWEANIARMNMALSHYRLGNLERAAEAARTVHEDGREIGDRQSERIGIGIWGRVAPDQVPRETLEEHLREPGDDVQALAEVAIGVASVRLAEDDDPEGAAEALEVAADRIDEEGVRQEYVAPVFPWLATARRRQLQALPQEAQARRDDLLDEARSAADRALEWADDYRNNLPHALREAGWLEALAGRPERARERFDRSLSVAEEQGAQLDEALTLRDRGRVGRGLGWEDADGDVEAGEAALSRLRPSRGSDEDRTLSLADRFSGVLVHGRQIAGSLGRDDICEATQEAARHLLRATDVGILAPPDDEGGAFETLAGTGPPAGKREILEEAVARGEVVRYPTPDEPEDGSRDPRVASALAAPVEARGENEMVIYAVHDEVRGVFGETEERLASFIAAIGGAALENAENVQRLQELTDQLEEKVEERTEELAQRADELEQALSLQRSTLDATADGILVVDEEGDIVSHNERFREMWGIPEEVMEEGDDEEAISCVLDQLADPEGFLERIEELYAHPEREAIDVIEFEDDRIFERYARPLKRGDEITGRVWSFRDVTEQRRARRKLERANEELRQQKEELRQAKEAAQEADRLKSAFLANTSHEIRTPLNAVVGLSTLLEDTDLDPRQREYLETIRSSSNHLLDLIDDILDLSRIEAGEMALAEAPVDVYEVVRGALDLVEPLADETDLRIHVDVDEEVPEVIVGDPPRLRQVLVNLLSNAVKFTDEGHVALRVHAPEGSDGPELAVEVEDTGPGIPESEREDLFDAFAQGDPSTTRTHEGTGLGLAICAEFVEMWGGTIDLESTVGEGTTFTVTHPIEEPREADGDETPPSPEGARVLVTAADQGRGLAERLRRMGAAARFVPADEVRDRAPAGDLDAVLVNAGEGDGDAAVARDLASQGLPVMVVSPEPDPLDGDLPGSVRVLRTPVSRTRISEALEEAAGSDEGSSPDQADLDLSVLVTEDNAVNREVAVSLVESLGCEADGADGGEAALEAASEGSYDVILMDIQMPDMDGYEATGSLLEHLGDEAPPVVALTAHADEEHRRRVAESPMVDYMSKPVDREEVEAVLREIAPEGDAP